MEIKVPESPPALSPDAERLLLKVARESIAAALRGEEYSPPEGLPAPLGEPGAVFVSLHLGADLRGCIGVTRPLPTLAGAVTQCARAAALEDPRFPPLGEEELGGSTIEISVLGGTRALAPGEMPRVGVDGLVVSKGPCHGLLLPQVAREHGWSPQRFLEEACRKAGLPRDAWKSGARVRAFQARVFSEGGAT